MTSTHFPRLRCRFMSIFPPVRGKGMFFFPYKWRTAQGALALSSYHWTLSVKDVMPELYQSSSTVRNTLCVVSRAER